MDLTLLHPPVWTLLEAPPLGVSTLAGVARAAGHEVRVRDLNLELLHFAASPEGRAQLEAACRRRLESADPSLDPLTREVLRRRMLWGLLVLDDLASGLPPLDELRRPELYEDPERMRLARRRVGRLQTLLFTLLQQQTRLQVGPASLAQQIAAAMSPTLDPVAAWLRARVEELIRERPSELWGISVTAPEQLSAALELAGALRASLPGALRVLGGACVTRDQELFRRTPALFTLADALVVHEGEEALLQLCEQGRAALRRDAGVPNLLFREGLERRLDHGRELPAPPRGRELPARVASTRLRGGAGARQRRVHEAEPGGVGGPCDGAVVRGPLREVSLGGLPSPDWSWVDWAALPCPERVVYLEASRGCYHGACAYCADHFAQLGHRARPVQRVVESLRAAAEQGAQAALFCDEALPPRLARQLCRALEGEEGLPIWGAELRPEPEFDRALLGDMVRAGCRRIQVGVESLSAPLLRRMARGSRPEDALALLKEACSQDLPVEVFLVDGLPTETEVERRRTLELLLELELPQGSWVACSPFHLDRGAWIYRDPARFGLELIDPARDGLFQAPFFRVAGEPTVFRARSAPRRPLVQSPGPLPPWPVEGHHALLWAARPRSPERACWRPALELFDPGLPRGLRGRALDEVREVSNREVFELVPELRLLQVPFDPQRLEEAEAAYERAVRAALSTGASRGAAAQRAAARAAQLLSSPRAASGSLERSQYCLLDLRQDHWTLVTAEQALILSWTDGTRSVAELALAVGPWFSLDPPLLQRELAEALAQLERSGVVRRLPR